jgi:TolB-like protein/Tfp pilus assembly protein PilF
MATVTGADDVRGGPTKSVFLSYSRADLERARPVITLLESAGFDVWWDGRLEGGENYLVTTETALETADCVLVLWSQTSVASHWVRDEAQRGRERGCLVPLSLDGSMAPLGFRQFQILDISDWSGDPAAPEAARIISSIRSRTGETATQPRSVASALSPATTTASIPARGFAVSRRNAVIGAVGVTGVVALGVSWATGLFAPGEAKAVSMVVLPFANRTGDTEKSWFSDGLSNELRSVLVRNPRLRVAAPTSSSAIGGEDDFAIGRKLGVEHILRGSVQRDETRLRVSAELVEIEGGLVRWAESYDRALEDVFAVQSEIAETVALSLVAEVASEDEARTSLASQEAIGGTSVVPAYEAFLRGQALYSLSAGIESDRQALAEFDAAIAADPEYAAAHAMRATMLNSIANAASTAAEVSSANTAAIAAAKRAIALEDRLAQGHLALAFALGNGQLDRAGALPHYQAAEQLAPGDGDVLRNVAIFYAYGPEQGRALQAIAKALELDPLNPRTYRTAGFVALLSRDYPAVIRHMERALTLNPSLVSAHFAIANARLMQGDAAGALTAASKERAPIFSLTAGAIASAKLGDSAAADKALAQIVADFGDAALYQQAQVRAQRGELAEALQLLERAYTLRDPGMLFAPNDPLLDPLRGQPKLGELLSRLAS